MAPQATDQIPHHLSQPLTVQLIPLVLPLKCPANGQGKLPRLFLEIDVLLLQFIERPGDGGVSELQFAINEVLNGMMDPGGIVEEIFQDIPEEAVVRCRSMGQRTDL